MENKIYEELLKIVAENNIEMVNNVISQRGLNGLYMNYGGRDFIALNKNLNAKKRNFILAHELGHFKLHREQIDNILYFNDRGYKEKKEKEANQYAMELINYLTLLIRKI